VGLPWLHNAKSGLLYGVGEDAAYISLRITTDDRLSSAADMATCPRKAGSVTIYAALESGTRPACRTGLARGSRRLNCRFLILGGAHHKIPNPGHVDPSRVARVAIVGTGFVGATTAYALLISGSRNCSD
jgi:hypothetical protein